MQQDDIDADIVYSSPENSPAPVYQTTTNDQKQQLNSEYFSFM